MATLEEKAAAMVTVKEDFGKELAKEFNRLVKLATDAGLEVVDAADPDYCLDRIFFEDGRLWFGEEMRD